MCGICGVINIKSGRPVERDCLEAMTRTMIHRGPDDEGYYLGAGVGLGHRRLSILDLVSGRQPLTNEDGSLAIVFNGEIYNWRELRRNLEAKGHQFRTLSDTEVIIHAYEEYGEAWVEQLNGMFAVAIWDSVRRQLILARDRTGIKPLYYAETDGVFVFASELKAILAHPAIPRRLDTVALNQYLSLEYVPTPRTIFENVKKLFPGSVLTVAEGRVGLRTYWDLDLSQGENSGSVRGEDLAVEFNQALEKVVSLEMLADVPVGVLLSGGLDSSTVAAVMSRLNPGRVQSFSISFEERSFDESGYARLAARHLGTEHHEMTLSPGLMLELVPRITDFMDEPLADSSIIPSYLLSEFTRRSVKVALGGDGGDELFGGYSTLQAHRLFAYYQHLLPEVVSRRLVPWLIDRLPVSFNNLSFDFKARRFVAGLGLPPVERHHRWLGSFTAEERHRLLGPLAQGWRNPVGSILESHYKAASLRDSINRIMYCDMKLYLEGDILPKVDRASMANSLEVRVPLLNNIMLDFASRLPLEFKLRGLTTKHILRRAMAGVLPRSIIRRGKKGFNIPVAKWLTGPLRPLAEDLFSAQRLKRIGLFDQAYVRSLLDEHLAGHRDNRKLLWTLLVFEMWQERWAA
jgi:asparagine synthase (glutamine-hydrolysing)